MNSTPTGPQTEPTSRPRLLIVFLARTVVNSAFRIIYPFLPSIARGLSISPSAAGQLVTLRGFAGLGAPLFGPLSDRRGRRNAMTIALAVFVLASLILAGIGTLGAAAVAFVLYGVAKAIYDPAALAYAGDSAPYEERGRAIGIVELSWSTAWLLGVPASGFLIERYGWRAPWAGLVGLGVLGAWLTHVRLPRTPPPATEEFAQTSLASLAAVRLSMLRRRSVISLLCTSLLLTLAIEIPFIVYGVWLETTFGLSLSALGLASIVIGLAEAAAEAGVTVVTDRLGKKRCILGSLGGLAVCLLALPWLSTMGLVPAMAGLASVVLVFEFGLVSLITLATELAPDARASLLSLNVVAINLGRILGALAGGWLWREEGIALHGGVGAACALVGVFVLTRGVRETDSYLSARVHTAE